MKVLVACEFSGIVREAFNARAGVYALSCDLLPAEDGRSDFHYQGDVRDIIADGWDLMIAHPPCTHLSSSGAAWFKTKRVDGRQDQAIEFFLELTRSDIPRWCIENPVGIMSRVYRKPDQIIQPFQFGDAVKKTTCLWMSIDWLRTMIRIYPRIAFGSSGDYSDPGTPKWWERMSEAMDAICVDGIPPCRLHGLRMLNPTIFSQLPFASADSTNVARNIGLDSKWDSGTYTPKNASVRAMVLADRIESHGSAATWQRTNGIQCNFELIG